MQIRVYYEDTDAGGIVYHANYLNFCERARSEMLFAQGKSPIIDGNHFVATKLEAQYKRPAKLGDILTVSAEVSTCNKASIVMYQTVKRDDELLFELTITLALTNSAGKPTRLTPAAIEMFTR